MKHYHSFQGIATVLHSSYLYLRDDIQTGIFESMRAFNLASQNQENIDLNTNNTVAPCAQDYGNLFDQEIFHYRAITPQMSLSINQIANNKLLTQLLQEMQMMKATINSLTLTNQYLTKTRNNQQLKGNDNDLIPKTGLPWEMLLLVVGLLLPLG